MDDELRSFLKENLSIRLETKIREYSDGSGDYQVIKIELLLLNPYTNTLEVISEATESIH